MEKLTLSWIAKATHGKLRGKNEKKVAKGISTDSRTIRKGEVFIALRGPHFNGHEHVESAAAHGAVAAVVEQAWATSATIRLPLIVVADTVVSLQRLARAYRSRHKDLRVIAVTGSNGKTTAKEMIAAVMTKQYRVAKSEGNLNNQIGVPLSILTVDPSDEVGIFELGINHPGELMPLVEICQPQIGVVTNIGQTHLEFLGDEAGVAAEKGILLEELPSDGLAVLNADDRWTETLYSRTMARITTVGFAAEADVRADNVRWEHGKLCFDLCFLDDCQVPEVWLNAVGKHQIYSALFAAAIAREFGIDVRTITHALGQFQSLQGRMTMEEIHGIHLINDTYNANPDSMCAALEALASYPQAQQRIALLGDMHELGNSSARGHRKVGAAAARLGLDRLLVVGDRARWIGQEALRKGLPKNRVEFFASAPDAGTALAQLAQAGDAILVKASRNARLEDAIASFRSQLKSRKKQR